MKECAQLARFQNEQSAWSQILNCTRTSTEGSTRTLADMGGWGALSHAYQSGPMWTRGCGKYEPSLTLRQDQEELTQRNCSLHTWLSTYFRPYNENSAASWHQQISDIFTACLLLLFTVSCLLCFTAIDFQTFLGFYKRLFAACRSVVRLKRLFTTSVHI